MTVDSTKLTSVNHTFNTVAISSHSLGILARVVAVQLTFTFVITSGNDPPAVPVFSSADLYIFMRNKILGSNHSC